MKKLIFSLLLINSYLFADSFEEKYREEIKKIILKEQQDYPNDYYMQSLMIKSQISKLKEIENLKQQYGIK